MDVFNHSFWKRYIKSLNDLDPGLNLLEKCTRNIMQVDEVEEVKENYKGNVTNSSP